MNVHTKHSKPPINLIDATQNAIKNKWVMSLSSDGYSHFGVGNNLTTDGYNLAGTSNKNAWWVLSKTIASQSYQFCIQTDGYMGLRLKYSKGGFIANTAGTFFTPLATDEVLLIGSGSNNLPIYQQVMFGNLGFFVNGVGISIELSDQILTFKLNPGSDKSAHTHKPKNRTDKILR